MSIERLTPEIFEAAISELRASDVTVPGEIDQLLTIGGKAGLSGLIREWCELMHSDPVHVSACFSIAFLAGWKARAAAEYGEAFETFMRR